MHHHHVIAHGGQDSLQYTHCGDPQHRHYQHHEDYTLRQPRRQSAFDIRQHRGGTLCIVKSVRHREGGEGKGHCVRV